MFDFIGFVGVLKKLLTFEQIPLYYIILYYIISFCFFFFLKEKNVNKKTNNVKHL
jgi:hypothetical protein